MIEQIFLHSCKDNKIGFQTVTNIRSKMEGIAYQSKNYGWKYKFQGSFKTKVTYITPFKLK